MSGSPQPPQVPVQQLDYFTPTSDDLRDIALRQRAIMMCIVGCFVCVLPMGALEHVAPVIGSIVAIAVALWVMVTAAVFAFRLSIVLYGTGIGVTLGILMLVPGVGILALLIVNGKATRTLRANGVQVGLLGARQIPAHTGTVPPPDRGGN